MDTHSDNPTAGRVPIEAAAAALSISVDAANKRIARGKLDAVKVKGRWWIRLEPSDSPTGQSEPPSDNQSALSPRIALLEARIALLEETVRRLEEERDRLAEALTTAQQLHHQDQVLFQQKALPTPEETKERRAWWQLWRR